MKLQQLLSYTRKAVDDYQMIDDGDHIAVGISGGKDSLTLLYALHGLKRFYPKSFRANRRTFAARLNQAVRAVLSRFGLTAILLCPPLWL